NQRDRGCPYDALLRGCRFQFASNGRLTNAKPNPCLFETSGETGRFARAPLSGEGGIRTLDGVLPPCPFTRQVPPATRPPLLGSGQYRARSIGVPGPRPASIARHGGVAERSN